MTEAAPRRSRSRPQTPPDPPPVQHTVEFKDLALHQVVGFATSFVQTVASLYVKRHAIGLPELRTIFPWGATVAWRPSGSPSSPSRTGRRSRAPFAA